METRDESWKRELASNFMILMTAIWFFHGFDDIWIAAQVGPARAI